jgi:hypothetical protein
VTNIAAGVGRATATTAPGQFTSFYASATYIWCHAGTAITIAVSCAVLQVLMLDADSLLLINPEQLFHSEPFATSGNLFWPGEPAGSAAITHSCFVALVMSGVS